MCFKCHLLESVVYLLPSEIHLCRLFFFFNIYLFIWQYWVLVVACRIFSCSMWALLPWPGLRPSPPALEAQSLSHWTTREVPVGSLLLIFKDLALLSPKESLFWYAFSIAHWEQRICYSSSLPTPPLSSLSFSFSLSLLKEVMGLKTFFPQH